METRAFLRRALTAIALTGFVAACSEEGPTVAPAEGPNKTTIYGSGGGVFSGSATHDTLDVASLTIRFPDGNSLRFGTTGTGVLASGTASGHTSNIGFGAGSRVSFGGQEVLLSTPAIGFFGEPATSRPTITGDRSNGDALFNLLSQLDDLGIITDATWP